MNYTIQQQDILLVHGKITKKIYRKEWDKMPKSKLLLSKLLRNQDVPRPIPELIFILHDDKDPDVF